MRNIKKSGKTRVIITLKCSECNQRFDVSFDTLKRQKYKGICTKCAHRKSAAYKILTRDEIVNRFESNGYKVLTPLKDINPKGHKGWEKVRVDIENKYGQRFKTSCNNFLSRLDYYNDLNANNYKDIMLGKESRFECKVRQYLESINIKFKQEFRITNCRGSKYPLSFDFCLNYDTENSWSMIEVDGERHFRSEFKDVQKNDRTKNYYCRINNIPLLRIPYDKFNNNDYIDMINDFIKIH